MSQPQKVHVKICYKDLKEEFSAQPQEAWLLINKFFAELVPSFEIAQKLVLNVDLEELACGLQGIVAFSGEGVNLLVPKGRLTDNEALLFWLAGAFLGCRLGLVGSDCLSKAELQRRLGKSAKIASTRLGELVKGEFAVKVFEDSFRITTFGVGYLQREIVPKIKAKLAV